MFKQNKELEKNVVSLSMIFNNRFKSFIDSFDKKNIISYYKNRNIISFKLLVIEKNRVVSHL